MGRVHRVGPAADVVFRGAPGNRDGDSRRATRTDENGALVLLEEQDRSKWDHDQIREGNRFLETAVGLPNNGPYVVQAAIAALHAMSESFDKTDWPQIAALYRGLYWMLPTPIVALNRAVAEAMLTPSIGMTSTTGRATCEVRGARCEVRGARCDVGRYSVLSTFAGSAIAARIA